MEVLAFVVGVLCGAIGTFIVFLLWLRDIVMELEQCGEQNEKTPQDI